MKRMSNTYTSRSEWKHGWPMVVAATIGYGSCLPLLSVCGGLFITPFKSEFGWTTSQAAFAPLIQFIVAFMMPFCGALIDRLGSRAIALFGVILFGIGFLSLALLPMSLVTLYSIAIILGILGATGNAGPYLRAVATWFERNRALAFGIVSSGTSLAGVVILPLVAAAIAKYGWRAGFGSMAIICLIITLPLVYFTFRERQLPATVDREDASSHQMGDFAVREALVDSRFWVLMSSLGIASIPMGAMLSHLQPILREIGFSLTTAAWYGSIFSLSVGIGRVGAGWLIDRMYPYAVATVMIGIGGLGCFALPYIAADSASWFIAAIITAIGLAYGAEVDFGAFFTIHLFGMKNFAKLYGIKALVTGLGISAGGMLASALRDQVGSYTLVGVISGICFVAAALAMAMLGVLGARHDRSRT